jgi:integrase
MAIKGHRFETRSKGKDLAGELPPEALEAVKAADLDPQAPFAGTLPNTLGHRVARAIKKLHKAGLIQGAYSCHDLRHFYATEEYRKNRDIHRLSKLLGHASIQVTETYLKGLGEIDS